MPVLVVDDREHFVLTQDEVILAVDRDFLAGVLAEQDRLTVVHVRRLTAAIVPDLTLASGDHPAALGLLLGGLWHDDAANRLFALVETLDDETVVKRCDFHVTPRSGRRMGRAPPRREAVATNWNDEAPSSIWGFR